MKINVQVKGIYVQKSTEKQQLDRFFARSGKVRGSDQQLSDGVQLILRELQAVFMPHVLMRSEGACRQTQHDTTYCLICGNALHITDLQTDRHITHTANKKTEHISTTLKMTLHPHTSHTTHGRGTHTLTQTRILHTCLQNSAKAFFTLSRTMDCWCCMKRDIAANNTGNHSGT